MRHLPRDLLFATLLVVSACSGGDPTEPDEPPTSTAPSATTAEEDEPLFSGTEDAVADPDPDPASDPARAAFADGPLAEVCGDRIVIQTSDFPDVGLGPLYALLGPTPLVDPDLQTASAPLTRADGTVEDVTLEIRSGGPAVGFRSPVAVMAEDDSVDIALASTAVAVRDHSLLATRAIATLTDRSHDAVIIDPATYPDVTDLATLGTQDIVVRHVTDAPVIAFLAASGVLTADRLQPGSDGLPASFVAAGGLAAQQGDLTIEPVLLPSLSQWGRPVTALPAAGAGWESLDDLLLVRDDSERLSDDCLGRFTRVVQQSIVAYVADASGANAVMSVARMQFNPLSRLTPELMDAGTQLAVDAGVFDIDRDDAPGTVPTDGLTEFVDELAAVLGVDAVATDELVDLGYLDPTISR